MGEPRVVMLTPEGDHCDGGKHRATVENMPAGLSALWSIESVPAGVSPISMVPSGAGQRDLSFIMPFSTQDQPVIVKVKLQ